MHLRIFSACGPQRADRKGARFFLVADSPCMLPKRNRAYMELLNVVYGANRQLSFFCYCQADVVERNKKLIRTW